jgi:hypothetical protein
MKTGQRVNLHPPSGTRVETITAVNQPNLLNSFLCVSISTGALFYQENENSRYYTLAIEHFT